MHKRTGGTVVIDGVHFDDAEIFIFIGIVDEIIICTSFEIFSVFSFFVIFLFVLILKSISRRSNSLNTPLRCNYREFFSVFLVCKIGRIFKLVITTMSIFGTAVAGTRGSVSAIVFERLKVRAVRTNMIVRTFIFVCT